MSFNKSLCVALGVLAATSVMAYEQSFETGADGNPLDLAGWGGYGTYSNTPAARVLAAGTPLITPVTHNVHLAVDGWVTNTLDGTAGDAQLDMLVKVALPDEALSGMTDEEAKFAMAIDSDGTLKYWTTNSVWSPLCTTPFTEGQWIRVAVIYDNGSQLCKVSVDGNACNTTSGYTTTNKTATGGAWYPLITTATKISSLKVVGTTALDDVKVAYNSNSSYVPQYKDENGDDVVVTTGGVDVPLAWFDKNCVATDDTTAPDGSGMTIADKYQTGMDPNSGETFAMKSMTMTESAGTVTATVNVPACTPPTGTV